MTRDTMLAMTPRRPMVVIRAPSVMNSKVDTSGKVSKDWRGSVSQNVYYGLTTEQHEGRHFEPRASDEDDTTFPNIFSSPTHMGKLL
ncbi:hypothetical protein TNCV_4170381 [Trichonephila clavipes]|nr:hypothetical protein TNCV_4170381 [Trichonephila clavipes]